MAVWLAGRVRMQSYLIRVFQWSSGHKINDVKKTVNDCCVLGHAACKDGQGLLIGEGMHGRFLFSQMKVLW